MFYVLSFFYGPIVSDTNKCMYVCMYRTYIAPKSIKESGCNSYS